MDKTKLLEDLARENSSLRCSVTLVDCQSLLEEKGLKKDDGYYVYVWTGDEDQCLDQGKIRVKFCPSCGKRFSQLDALRRHQRMHIEQTSYSCSQDERRMQSVKASGQALGQKSLLPSRLKPNSCFVCGFKSTNPKTLEQHRRKVHQVATVYSCVKCKKNFESLELLNEHDEIQHKLNLHTCMQCDESYSDLEDLHEHHAMGCTPKHKIGRKPYSCHICGLGFSSLAILESHTKTHDKRNFQCPTCGDRFVTEGNLSAHLRVHMSELYFHSDKIFATTSGSVSQSTFPCTMCHMRFSNLVDLRDHQRDHTSRRYVKAKD
ncbi:zinc finger protein 596-like [Hoplias malabaricus]|uniref:zinc finger protein 596-like n=1 Tax=Hoplias malabaricus TaxID=27720 RepID=UPI0034636A1C